MQTAFPGTAQYEHRTAYPHGRSRGRRKGSVRPRCVGEVLLFCLLNQTGGSVERLNCHFTLSMLRVCRRMMSSIASLKIPEISQRMTVKFAPAMEPSAYFFVR